MGESPGVNLRVIKARAKHFQDSLFNSVKSSNATKLQSVSERELRKDSSGSGDLTVSPVDSYRSHDVPTLNAHGLITVAEPEVART